MYLLLSRGCVCVCVCVLQCCISQREKAGVGGAESSQWWFWMMWLMVSKSHRLDIAVNMLGFFLLYLNVSLIWLHIVLFFVIQSPNCALWQNPVKCRLKCFFFSSSSFFFCCISKMLITFVWKGVWRACELLLLAATCYGPEALVGTEICVWSLSVNFWTDSDRPEGNLVEPTLPLLCRET